MPKFVPPKLVILGVDGGDPHLLNRFMNEGRLPNIREMAVDGTFCPLHSTTPPTTFPAWTNLLTGTTPGIHGITDFTVKNGYRVRFVGAAERKVRTMFEYMGDNGLRVGAAWFPATYPPLRLNGYNISGWDSPVTDKGDASFVQPVALHEKLQKRFPDAHLRFSAINEFDDSPQWYADAKKALLKSVSDRTKMAIWLLENEPTDVAAFYFGETDTVAHHFYAFSDPNSPRRPPSVPRGLETAIAEVYERVDVAVGTIRQRVGNAPILLVSDHGVMGNSNIALYLNRFLEQQGFLRFKPEPIHSRGITRNHVRFVPSQWRRNLFRAFGGLFPSWYESKLRFGRIDFDHTIAFSEEIPYAPAIWLNQLGRDPKGTVRFREREDTLSKIEDSLASFTHSDGTPVVRCCHRRETIHQGGFHLFPDLILELTAINGYLPVCRNSNGRMGAPIEQMPSEDLLGRKGTSMPGGHAPEGIFVSSIPFPDLSSTGLHLHEVASLVYELVDIWPPEEGEMTIDDTKAVPKQRQRTYSLFEQRVVAERLKRLGYLEE